VERTHASLRCGLTLRSSGEPPAWHLARDAPLVILRLAGQAPCRRLPLSSNVRRRMPEVLHGRRTTTLRPVVLGYPPARRVRECGLPQHRSDFGPRMLGRTRIGVACWPLRINSARPGWFHEQVALEGPPQSRPCRQSSCGSGSPKASQPVRLPPSSSQLRRLPSLATGEQRRLTLRSRADPPRQGTLAARPSMFIIGRAAKVPCLYGPLSSNVRRRNLPCCRPSTSSCDTPRQTQRR
jgi:hypothetical protein